MPMTKFFVGSSDVRTATPEWEKVVNDVPQRCKNNSLVLSHQKTERVFVSSARIKRGKLFLELGVLEIQ
ncbi:hypothetical protein WA026_019580, partial [Henosepilachna vigintioctopunctata]